MHLHLVRVAARTKPVPRPAKVVQLEVRRKARLETAYSDLDFCLALRFKSKDGTKRELPLCQILSPTGAL